MMRLMSILIACFVVSGCVSPDLELDRSSVPEAAADEPAAGPVDHRQPPVTSGPGADTGLSNAEIEKLLKDSAAREYLLGAEPHVRIDGCFGLAVGASHARVEAAPLDVLGDIDHP